MKDLSTALVSGLIGALIAAFLSYKVRLKAKAKEDEDERKRLALVNFLLLTDVVASDFFMKDFIERISKLGNIKAEGFGISHAFSVFLASKIAALGPDDLGPVRVLFKPFVSAATSWVEKFEIKPSDLGRMHEVTIYAYHRHRGAAAKFLASLSYVDAVAEKGQAKMLDAAFLHGLYQAYRAYADTAGVLRAALGKSAGVSSDYSTQCLIRSFNAVKADAAAVFEQSAKLELAKKATEATNADSVTDAERVLQSK